MISFKGKERPCLKWLVCSASKETGGGVFKKCPLFFDPAIDLEDENLIITKWMSSLDNQIPSKKEEGRKGLLLTKNNLILRTPERISSRHEHERRNDKNNNYMRQSVPNPCLPLSCSTF